MIEKILFTDEEIQSANDAIAVFCGGILEFNPLMGEQYRFDTPGTPKHMMKCPPFGVISRKGMMYHCDYDWLIDAIKNCYEKKDTPILQAKYDEIIELLTDFSWIDPMRMTFSAIAEFVYLYNDEIEKNTSTV